jgi:hypothetical protein
MIATGISTGVVPGVFMTGGICAYWNIKGELQYGNSSS